MYICYNYYSYLSVLQISEGSKMFSKVKNFNETIDPHNIDVKIFTMPVDKAIKLIVDDIYQFDKIEFLRNSVSSYLPMDILKIVHEYKLFVDHGSSQNDICRTFDDIFINLEEITTIEYKDYQIYIDGDSKKTSMIDFVIKGKCISFTKHRGKIKLLIYIDME